MIGLNTNNALRFGQLKVTDNTSKKTYTAADIDALETELNPQNLQNEVDKTRYTALTILKKNANDPRIEALDKKGTDVHVEFKKNVGASYNSDTNVFDYLATYNVNTDLVRRKDGKSINIDKFDHVGYENQDVSYGKSELSHSRDIADRINKNSISKAQDEGALA